MAIEAIGAGLGAVASIGYYSTLLSSPWTIEKFTETDEQKAKVRRLYIIATLLSVATGLFLAIMLKEWWIFLIMMAICGIYIYYYEKALKKEL